MELKGKEWIAWQGGFARTDRNANDAGQVSRQRWMNRLSPAFAACMGARWFGLVALLALFFCFSTPVNAADNQNASAAPVANSDATAKTPVSGAAVSDLPGPRMGGNNTILMAVLVFIVFAFAAPVAVVLDRKRRSSTVTAASKTRSHFKDFWKEERSMMAFFRALKAGPAPRPGSRDPAGQQPGKAATLEAKFFESAPTWIEELKNLFEGADNSNSSPDQKRTLGELGQRLSIFKDSCTLPELAPMWQMACALEALVKQLATQKADVTNSCLRTVSGGLDLLQRLCGRKLDPQLATNPPVKLLVVDDDAVSRLALSVALKRAFTPPDMAADGTAALAQVDRQTYDIVFLDVEMPGLDGFEVCSRIHQTALNRRTPVVFVTQHRDFQFRVKAASCGGYELIEKPFVGLEITVKALTLVLGSRYASDAARKAEAVAKDAKPEAPVAKAEEAAKPVVEAKAAAAVSASEVSKTEEAQKTIPASSQLLDSTAQTQSAGGTENAVAAHLGKLFASAYALTTDAEKAELSSARRLGTVLQEVLRELLRRPDSCTSATQATAEFALDLLGELCKSQANPSLTQPPMRIMVVDDDPIARRAVGLSLQAVFGKPESADSGEAAVALAAEKTFDLIFMDVLMPGMDGFAACTKIHASASNGDTPVVFVTGQRDNDSRNNAFAAGGCGFLSKPISNKVILLTALTYSIRGRLNRAKLAPALQETA
jgi:CheY-like chemotaxis protein